MLNTERMRVLPLSFTTISDPRRGQGCRHRLAAVLALTAGATRCGMRSDRAISGRAEALGQSARRRFGGCHEQGRYVVPSTFVIRDCLVRIAPEALDLALSAWTQAWGAADTALAIDAEGRQTHIMSVIGSGSNTCHTRKVGSLRVISRDEAKRTNGVGMAIPLRDGCAIAGKVITTDAP